MVDNFFSTINKIISSPLWALGLYVILFCLVVLWLVLVFWTYKDARKRIDDPVIVGVAVLTSLVLPYLGTLVYAILRPAEYIAEARERELEMRAMEQELHTLRACPSCGEVIRPDYLACPSCRRPLRTACPSCDRVLEPGWKLCPYCAHDLKARRVPPPAEASHSGRVTAPLDRVEAPPGRTEVLPAPSFADEAPTGRLEMPPAGMVDGPSSGLVEAQ